MTTLAVYLILAAFVVLPWFVVAHLNHSNRRHH